MLLIEVCMSAYSDDMQPFDICNVGVAGDLRDLCKKQVSEVQGILVLCSICAAECGAFFLHCCETF